MKSVAEKAKRYVCSKLGHRWHRDTYRMTCTRCGEQVWR